MECNEFAEVGRKHIIWSLTGYAKYFGLNLKGNEKLWGIFKQRSDITDSVLPGSLAYRGQIGGRLSSG